MSDNISKKSFFKKDIFKIFSIKKNVSKDKNDKDKSKIKDEVGKNDVSVNSLFAKVYLIIECQ